MIQELSGSLQRQIMDVCRHITKPYEIVAICQSDDYVLEVPSAKSTIEVLIVLRNFPPRLISNVRVIDGRNVVFFVVEKWTFERDVDRSFLGEALASILIFPYSDLSKNGYFHKQEIMLKKRLIVELIENIIVSYPELSHCIRIKPEYFMYEVILNRVRVFPPMAYSASNFLSGTADKEKVALVLKGYLEALGDLKKEGITYASGDGFVMLTQKTIEANKNPNIRFTNSIKNAPRTLFTSFLSAFPQLLNFLSNNSEAFFRFQTPPWKLDFSRNFLDPQEYVFFPTANGLVSLAERTNVSDYALKLFSRGECDKVKIERIGGVLNDVSVLRVMNGGSERKILVKRFKDLSSLKWFPLSIWSVGVRSFAMLGLSRLERECAINEVLFQAGMNVPKILHVSASERLIFMEFVEGDSLGTVVKQMGLSHDSKMEARALAAVDCVGRIYAQVHDLNIVLGDTKPENIILRPDGKLFLLDFEQASRSGDKSWDIACFLYYCGHYMPIDGEQKAEALTKKFISGYLEAGGDIDTVKSAGIKKYTRIFSIFTLPSILWTMSTACLKAIVEK